MSVLTNLTNIFLVTWANKFCLSMSLHFLWLIFTYPIYIFPQFSLPNICYSWFFVFYLSVYLPIYLICRLHCNILNNFFLNSVHPCVTSVTKTLLSYLTPSVFCHAFLILTQPPCLLHMWAYLICLCNLPWLYLISRTHILHDDL